MIRISVPIPAERCCQGKSAYSTEYTARMVGSRNLRGEHENGRHPDTDKLWPYPCPHGRHWHLTSHGGGRNASTVAITAAELWEGIGL